MPEPKTRSSACSASCCRPRRKQAPCGVISTWLDVKAILVGCLAMQAANPEAAERLTEVVLDGLRSGVSDLALALVEC